MSCAPKIILWNFRHWLITRQFTMFWTSLIGMYRIKSKSFRSYLQIGSIGREGKKGKRNLSVWEWRKRTQNKIRPRQSFGFSWLSFGRDCYPNEWNYILCLIFIYVGSILCAVKLCMGFVFCKTMEYYVILVQLLVAFESILVFNFWYNTYS